MTFDSSFTKSADELAEAIRALQYSAGGATWSRQTLLEAKETFFTPTLGDADRQRLVVMISDGVATETQEPCEVLQDYLDSSINILSYTVGTTHKCNLVGNDNLVLRFLQNLERLLIFFSLNDT